MTIVEEYSVEIMKLILLMTFTGSIISIFLFILKPVIKDKLPKSFQYYMWLSVVIAFMLPVSKMIVIPISNQSVMPMKSINNIQQSTNFPSIAVILFVFWQLGMILFLGFHMICYVLYVRKLNKHNRSAKRQEIELLNSLLKRKNSLRLYKNAIVKTPLSIGIFRPVVILPNKKCEDRELRNILMHEMIRHKKV